MASAERILLVAPSERLASTIGPRLEAAGYEVVRQPEFVEARAALHTRPDLVITEIKLGPYNGLHLAILAGSSGTPAIVIGDPDAVLQGEAERQGAAYLTSPVDLDHLIVVVGDLLTAAGHKRRSPRKRVPELDALVDNTHVRVFDVSHEGMRIEAVGGGDTLPATFIIRLPMFDFQCRVERVWISPAQKGDGTWCGATLSPSDIDTALAWRALVDKLPGSSVMH